MYFIFLLLMLASLIGIGVSFFAPNFFYTRFQLPFLPQTLRLLFFLTTIIFGLLLIILLPPPISKIPTWLPTITPVPSNPNSDQPPSLYSRSAIILQAKAQRFSFKEVGRYQDSPFIGEEVYIGTNGFETITLVGPEARLEQIIVSLPLGTNDKENYLTALQLRNLETILPNSSPLATSLLNNSIIQAFTAIQTQQSYETTTTLNHSYYTITLHYDTTPRNISLTINGER